MEGIYKIQDNNPFIEKLDFTSIGYYELVQDVDFDAFVIKIFSQNSIKKLVIPVHLGNAGTRFRGLKLALHIRLTVEIGMGRLIPIIFVSDDDLEDNLFLAKNNKLNLNYLLLTEGCVLAEENAVLIQKLAESQQPIDPLKFKSQVLNRLKILPSEEIGKHALANQWGAFRLDEMAHTLAFEGKKELKNKQKELYFKYIRSFNDDYNDLNKVNNTANLTPKTVNSQGKKILLIDDEANKGWSDVLSKIFIGADFQAVTAINFQQLKIVAENKIQQEDWDLVLLDLRLNPTEEERSGFIAEGKIENYSGTKLLQFIKAKNKGTQVIIFTASNKAWNMKSLLDLGADGYFIKESPELGFSNDFSKENVDNFLETAKNCLEKGYLQDIFKQKMLIDTELRAKKGRSTEYDDFLDDLKTQLEISYNTLSHAITPNDFVFAYILIYRVLEIIGDKLITKNTTTNESEIDGHLLLNYLWNENSNTITINTSNSRDSIFKKISGLYHQKLGLNDNNFYEKIWWTTFRRNKIIHPNNETPASIRFLEIAKGYNEKGYLEAFDIVKLIIQVV